MKKENNNPIRISSVSELHRLLGLPKPLHPLVSLMLNTDMVVDPELLPNSFLFDFYKISYKRTMNAKMRYGQGYYDFEEGGMIFTAPNQLISVDEADREYEGYSLVIHPDFIRNYPLGKRIKSYGFFSYDTHEALHLSEKEKSSILRIIESIKEELHGAIDDFSQDVIVSYIEVLLSYSNRFYKRQFITRNAVNHELLSRMEQLLDDYFNNAEPLKTGMLTVEYLAAQLHLSPP